MTDRSDWENRAARGDGAFAIALALENVADAVCRVAQVMNAPTMLENKAPDLVDGIQTAFPSHLDVTVHKGDDD